MPNLNEAPIIVLGALLIITFGVAFEYFRQLIRIRKEYGKTKEIVGDIVLSFNKQLEREARKIDVVAYTSNATSSKCKKALDRVEQINKRISTPDPRIERVLADQEKILSELLRINNQIRDTTTSHKVLAEKISVIEKQAEQLSVISEPRIETAIPFKKEKVLAPLTETELSVLEALLEAGQKTAPQMKDKINLSREHTARLMKKLYKDGYLERDTTKLPFRYRIKKEMKKLLTRNKVSPPTE